jgi:5'-nucleotidase
MTTQRRDFIKHSSFIAGGLLLTNPLEALASFSKSISGNDEQTFSILHTNDLHNQIDPVQWGKKSGLGGLKNIHRDLKKAISRSMLLDAGDFLDDAASFADHRKMINAMNQTGYVAATIGNRELARGEEYLADLVPYLKFPLVNCNYSFSNEKLKESIQPYIVRKSGKYRIGITGVGPRVNIEGVTWHHPYAAANKIAKWLKAEKSCDLVICLSHIGYTMPSARPGNTDFAGASIAIDLILSGHQQHLSNGLLVCKNKNKEEVVVSHAGESGMVVKQITIIFDENKKRRQLLFRNFVPGLQEDISTYSVIRTMNA